MLQIRVLEADGRVASTVLLTTQDIIRMREVHMELATRCDARLWHLMRLLWGGAFQSDPRVTQLRPHRPNTIGSGTCPQSNACDAILVDEWCHDMFRIRSGARCCLQVTTVEAIGGQSEGI